jgi:anaerobic selenocysteine-containing dehydrogenase
LYADGIFNTSSDICETYGHDLLTGGARTPEQHRAIAPAGRAFLIAVEHEAGAEQPDDEHPLLLTTGRTVYQFHTRTKTARSPQLDAAAPDVWVEVAVDDATALGIGEGDVVDVATARGTVRARARVSGIRPGVVFVPMHYGYWDEDASGPDAVRRAANELTRTAWDPVSKQPMFKVAAARVTKVAAADGHVAPAPTTGAPAPVTGDVPPTTGGPAAAASSTWEEAAS